LYGVMSLTTNGVGKSAFLSEEGLAEGFEMRRTTTISKAP